MENYKFMTSHARCIFHGKFILKNIASLDSMIVSTAISGTIEFIIKNLVGGTTPDTHGRPYGPHHQRCPSPQDQGVHGTSRRAPQDIV